MRLNVQRLDPAAILPKYATAGDAGMDLFALENIEVSPGERVQVRTGVAVEIPVGYVGLIWDKSGIAQKNGLKTLGGVVDSGYRGEVLIGIVNLSDKSYTFEKGHKVAQMLIQKVENIEVEEVSELSDSERGASGFGSTGK